MPVAPARGWRRTTWALTFVGGLAAALTCCPAPSSAVAQEPASATGGVEAAVHALAAKAVADARHAHLLAVAYNRDQHRLAALRLGVAEAQRAVRRLDIEKVATEAQLRAQALLSYTGSLTAIATAGARPTGTSSVQASDRTIFLTLAVGNLTVTLTRYQQETAEEMKGQRSLGRQVAEALKAARQAQRQRDQALHDAYATEALLARAQRQLAERRAQAGAQAASSAPQGSGARSDAPAGPPIGNGLVQAVASQLRPGLGNGGNGSALAGTTTTPAVSTSTTTGTTTMAGTTTTAATVPTGGSGTTTSTAPPTPTPTTARASPTGPAPATTSSTPPNATTTSTSPPGQARPTTTARPTGPTGSASAGTSATSKTAATSYHPPPAGGVWQELRDCESGGNYQANTGNGFYGAYQFSASTWSQMGYPGRPDQEPYWMQDEAAQRLQAAGGWGQWPTCSAALGL